jgi:hypothetical protein
MKAELLDTLEAMRRELERAERIARRDPHEALAAALKANKKASRRLQSVALHSPR